VMNRVVFYLDCSRRTGQARRGCGQTRMTRPFPAVRIVNIMADPGAPYTRSLELLSRHESKLLIVDVQEKLVPRIFELHRLLANCRTLIQAAKIVGVPVYATEQYPKGLGGTVPQLAELLEKPAQKLRFSCAEVLAWDVAAGQTDNRFQVVVAGMEAHVCVVQT